ncbi:GPALPP motifs-containing protein 1 [Lamellibrachia satsuma]|nr:GPALPP motifs-containing protein 1 [Lamellibrachia satsuma]
MADSNDDLPPIGPALPPGFQTKHHSNSSNIASKRVAKSPAVDRIIGPALPPGFLHLSHSDNDSDDNDITPHTSLDTKYASGALTLDPALPPGFRTNPENATPEKHVLGPTLPPDVSCKLPHAERSASAEDIGPVLPPGFRNELAFDDDIIGPLPPSSDQQSEYSAAAEFEERALRMREKLLNIKPDDGAPERESWMMELPPERSTAHNLLGGLVSRKFRKDGGGSTGGDRSEWTDTPADKERKEKEMSEGKGVKRSRNDQSPPRLSARDEHLAEQVKKYNESSRSKSLLELHSKKLHKEKKKEKKKQRKEKKEEKKLARRPFDRELDMQVNRFDDAQKKSIIKKSQLLNTRFGHSKTGQFL